MRKLLVPAAAAALLATSAISFAAAQHATGTIKTYDAKAQTLTLATARSTRCPRCSRIRV